MNTSQFFMPINYSVLDVVMSCEMEVSSSQEVGYDRKSVREQGSILSYMAATCDFYGAKYVINFAHNLKQLFF